MPRPKTGSPWAALVCVAQRTSNIRGGCIRPSSGQMASQSSPSGSDGVSAEPTTKKKKRKKKIIKKQLAACGTLGAVAFCAFCSALRRREPRAQRERAKDSERRYEAPAALRRQQKHIWRGSSSPSGQRLRDARDDRRWVVVFRRTGELMGAETTSAKRRGLKLCCPATARAVRRRWTYRAGSGRTR